MECGEGTIDFESPSALANLSISGSRVSYSFKLVLDSIGHDIMSLFFGHILFYSFIFVSIIFSDIVFEDYMSLT